MIQKRFYKVKAELYYRNFLSEKYLALRKDNIIYFLCTTKKDDYYFLFGSTLIKLCFRKENIFRIPKFLKLI